MLLTTENLFEMTPDRFRDLLRSIDDWRIEGLKPLQIRERLQQEWGLCFTESQLDGLLRAVKR